MATHRRDSDVDTGVAVDQGTADAVESLFDDILGADVLFSDYAIQVVKEKILSVPGVRSVDKAELTIDGRKISGKIALTLDNGERTEMEL